MAPKEAFHRVVSDPDRIPETLCDGPFNLAILGQHATLTFTHVRPNAGPMFAESKMEYEAIVRARVVLTTANLLSLRDLLNKVVKADAPAENIPPVTSGGTRH